MMRTAFLRTAVFTAMISGVAAPVAWAAPLPTDPSLSMGKLDNGVTWIYRQHDNPPGKMAAIIHMRTGSLNETEEQRGLAHFMEHMCFNGSENFPPGELIPYFESIGMQFGADLNAFTSFDQTAYMLFLPDTKKEEIDKALMVLSDFAFRVSLLPEEIDKERGVILEESRTGKNARQRMRDELWPELFEGSRFAQRLPIGLDEVIASAPRKEFVDYYRTWYRPENLTVIMVGDAPKENVIPYIEKWFGTYKPEVTAQNAEKAGFKPFTHQRAMVVTDREYERADFEMVNLQNGRPPTTTEAQWRTDLVDRIASWILSRRMEERVKKGEASYNRGSATIFDFFNEALYADASAEGEPDQWNKILDETVTEVNRALEHGFTENELNLARKELLSRAERSAETESTMDARGFLFGIMSAVNDRVPYMSAAQELDLYRKYLDDISLSEVEQAFRKYYTPDTMSYVLYLPEKEGVDVPDTKTILASAKSAWAKKVDAYKEDAAPTTILAELPEPGKVVEKSFHDGLAVTSAYLSNGVRVHHRFMDYKKDSVWVTVSLAGGLIEETAGNNGVTDASLLAINEPATHRLTSSNVRDLMTGRKVRVSGGNENDSVVVEISGSPKDLEHGLQLAHALLTDAKIEQAAFDTWKSQTLERIDRRERQPFFKAIEAMSDIVSGDDPRRFFVHKEDVEARTRDEAQAWFDRLAAKAPIEIAVVGDIKLEDAMPLIERYFGSLAKRPRTADNLDSLRKFNRASGPWQKHEEVDIAAPQAVAITGFLSCDGREVPERRAMEIAQQILSSRLIKRIREDLSLVYSIRASNAPSWIYRNSGRFMAGSQCDPANTGKLTDEVRAMFADFAEKGPTDEELSNAKKQIANDLDTSMREPGYWLAVLQHLDLHDRNLDDEAAEQTAYDGIPAERVREVFAFYNKPERMFNVTVVPAAKEKSGDENKEKAGVGSSN
ncbi:MAG: insulinase family protein [Phycisphaerae bacterium]|nr:insulinase family protein [Phycisphaerae bacterium]